MYYMVFYRSTKDRRLVYRDLAIAGLFFVGSTLYVILGGLGYTGQTRHEAAQVAGIMSDVTVVVMYASPLVKIVQVFKYKSAVFIPIHMVAMGAVNMAIWSTYSVLAKKWIILIPSSGSFCMNVFQMVLYLFIYNPKTHPLPADYKATTSKDQETHHAVTMESPRNLPEIEFVTLESSRV